MLEKNQIIKTYSRRTSCQFEPWNPSGHRSFRV